MEWPFISQPAEIELTLLVGIASIDLRVLPLCSALTGFVRQLKRDEGVTSLRKKQATVHLKCFHYPTGSGTLVIVTGGICCQDLKDEIYKVFFFVAALSRVVA